MNRIIKTGLLSCVLVVSAPLIHAASIGAYVGGGGGLAYLDNDTGLQQANHNTPAGRIFLGYNFSDFFGLELDYMALGKTSYFDPAFPFITGEYTENALSLVGKLYIAPSPNVPINCYVFLGAVQEQAHLNVVYHQLSLLSDSDEGMTATGGLGISYDLNQHFRTDFEVKWYNDIEHNGEISVLESTVLTLNLAYKF